jgi:hypothetical protein
MMCIFAWALIGCGGGGSDDAVINGGLVNLTAVDGASLAGLTFDYTDATIFGFPGESATLGIGDSATTFTLTTSGGTVINGTITAVASAPVGCQLTQNLQEVGAGGTPFVEQYDTCQATVNSQGAIIFGASGPGTVTLSFNKIGGAAVASAPEAVILNLRDDGTVTINNNATPI